jgi:DNA-binding transcriptional regulator LsrR (DeoR family)
MPDPGQRGRPGNGSKSARSKKRAGEELDELAIEAARLIYEEDLTAGQALRRLKSERAEVRDERDVRRLAARARDPDNPLVRVRVEPINEPKSEDLQDVAFRLAEAAGLRSVLLTRSELSSEKDYASRDDRQRRQAYSDSDRLHRRLGGLAAQHVWARIKEGDCVAIGGGRAPAHTVETLERMVGQQWRLDRIQVVSLSARFGEKEWGTDDVQRKLDADDLLDRLGRSLAKDYQPWPVEFALASQPSREAPDIIAKRAPQLADEPWGEPPRPDIALFGVSVVHAGHPLLAPSSKAYTKGIEPILDDVRRQLGGEAFLADVCNVHWVAGERTSDNFGEQARIARRLNQVCIAISPNKLDQAEEKILVAGGAQKYPAILGLLKDDGDLPKPTTLVTDQAIAERLVRALRTASDPRPGGKPR